jgi:four helix bundle protein
MPRQRLEDLNLWVLSREANRQAYSIILRVRDPDYRAQMKRAALSISSNIAEGHGRNSNPAFIQFLNYAQGSISELKSQFLACTDVGLLKLDDIKNILAQLDQLSAMNYKLILYLKTHRKPTTDN